MVQIYITPSNDWLEIRLREKCLGKNRQTYTHKLIEAVIALTYSNCKLLFI